MGRQIVRQPNGLYAVWSSNVDDFIMVDATEREIGDDWVLQMAEELRKDIRARIDQLEKGGKPYFQFTRSFDECVDTIRQLHGDGAESLALLGITKTR